MNPKTRLKLAGAGLASATLLGGGALLGAPATMPHYFGSGDSTVAPAIPGRDGVVDSALVRSRAVVPALGALNDAFATTAARVKSSVVYITARHSARHVAAQPGQDDLPPEFRRFFQQMPGMPPMGGDDDAPRGGGIASGSGFVVSEDGYILTNAHVVDGADKVTVRLLDRREFTAKVVGADPSTDVAVLKVDAKGLMPAALGSSDAARVGEWVLAVGNPLGENLTFTVTSGIISAKGRALQLPGSSARSIQDFIQTDAAINPGNSGGPLVNVAGEVIGINSAIASPTGTYAGYGFAVPIDLAKDVMHQLIDHGSVRRAALGISVRDATPEDAAYAGLPSTSGVVVQDFASADSPAKTAGLQPGDVIVAVDGKAVDYVSQLQERVAFRKGGETVTLTVARKGGARVQLPVRLQQASAEVSQRESSRDANDDGAPADARQSEVGALGLTVAPLDASAARTLQLPESARGVVVTGVAEDGPASGHVAAVGEGGPDVLLSVEGTAVRTPAELQGAVAKLRSGDVVTLRLYNAPARSMRVERVRVR